MQSVQSVTLCSTEQVTSLAQGDKVLLYHLYGILEFRHSAGSEAQALRICDTLPVLLKRVKRVKLLSSYLASVQASPSVLGISPDS